MDPIEWLCENVPGFRELPDEDRQAIFHFSLLWSLFEARALDTHASISAIVSLSHEWEAQGRLDAAPLAESLDYFRHRYYQSGNPTPHIRGLNLGRHNSSAMVHAVLKGDNTDPADNVAALLIIIYRLRNNLFHGVKWEFGIRDQKENFTHANIALMSALSIHGPP